MADYLKNTILNFSRAESGGYSVSDYLSKDITELLDYIDTFSSDYFSWYQLQNNDSIERVAQDIYGNADYWDILLLVNRKNPLVDMPYHFDAVYNNAEATVQDYSDDIYGTIPDNVQAIMLEAYTKELSEKNESFRIMRIITPSKMSSFLQKGFEDGYF